MFFFSTCNFNKFSFIFLTFRKCSIIVLFKIISIPSVSQVQQRSGVWHRCHAGISGAADQDAAADSHSDDHRQPTDRRSAGPAGGGRLISWDFVNENFSRFKSMRVCASFLCLNGEKCPSEFIIGVWNSNGAYHEKKRPLFWGVFTFYSLWCQIAAP